MEARVMSLETKYCRKTREVRNRCSCVVLAFSCLGVLETIQSKPTKSQVFVCPQN